MAASAEFDERSQPSPPRARKRFTVALFVDALFLAAFVALLVHSYRLGRKAQNLSAALERARVQASLLTPDFDIGDRLLDLSVTTSDGRKETLRKQSAGGKSLVWIVDPDCPACLREAEGLSLIRAVDTEQRRLVVLTGAPPEKLGPFLTRFGIRPSAVGSVVGLSVQRQLRGVHLPQLLYLDEDARVTKVSRGVETNPGKAAKTK
jgi:hypothetical protein